MTNIRFVLVLDQVDSLGNAARMWLDTSRDDVLQKSEEVTLGTIDGKTWLGQKTISGPTTGMVFLVKFFAPIGVTWSFVATDGVKALYELADQTTSVQPEALIGRLK